MNPIRIYIVEDELLISASLKSQLEQFGYEISGSSIRGESCLDDIAELSRLGREPEIVLMDIHLRGEMDGIETAKILNEKFNCAIIFLTGQSSKEIYERSFKIKPFGYLLKPIDMEQTKMTIEIASYQRNLEIENTLYQKDLEALLEKRSQENRELMAMYQTIVNNSVMGLTIMQDERFVFANNRTAEIFGYPLDDFLQFTCNDILKFVHPDDRNRMIRFSRSRFTSDDTMHTFRGRIFTPHGLVKHIETHVKPVLFKDKPAFHQTFLDITAYQPA
ncbi:MAG TPA: response regulator [Bacteroidales bacterium]|nr:response regulator [Bacteroidales bacterium]